MRRFAAFMVFICALHGIVTSVWILQHDLGSRSYATAPNGDPVRVFPDRQSAEIAIGFPMFVVSCLLFVRNRWMTTLLFLATLMMFLVWWKNAQENDSPIGAVGAVFISLIWFIPQMVALLVLLGLTWNDHRGFAKIWREARADWHNNPNWPRGN